MGLVRVHKKTHSFFAPDYWEENRLRRLEAKRAADIAEKVLVHFDLSMREAPKGWYSKRKSDRFIIVTPLANIPESVLKACLNPGYAKMGKGFLDRSIDAVVFNADHAFAPFIEALRRSLDPVQQEIGL